MKYARILLAGLLLVTAANAQATKDLGQGAFANESGAILVAVDAAMVNQAKNSPYVMFVVFLASRDVNQPITVAAKDVVMVYKGQEYRMPSVKELRSEYQGGVRDVDFYRHLGKEGIMASWVRFYDFPEKSNFFPPQNLGAPLAADEGYMLGDKGFLTPLYFKNPGFAKGDTLTIKVRDKKNAELTGECDVVLK